jgi:hypothetical protein
MDLQVMTTKVTHSLKNITNHSSSEAASHPRRLESLAEQHVQGADKSLAQPGRKQATATEDFEFHISYL